MTESNDKLGYQIAERLDEEVWPLKLVVDGEEVAQFKGIHLAIAVRDELNARYYFPPRKDKVTEALRAGGSESHTPPHVLDMPSGA